MCIRDRVWIVDKPVATESCLESKTNMLVVQPEISDFLHTSQYTILSAAKYATEQRKALAITWLKPGYFESKTPCSSICSSVMIVPNCYVERIQFSIKVVFSSYKI